jgi:hypothetical protein
MTTSNKLERGQRIIVTQVFVAAFNTFDSDQNRAEPQAAPVAVNIFGSVHDATATHRGLDTSEHFNAMALRYRELRPTAEMFADAQKLRMAVTIRIKRAAISPNVGYDDALESLAEFEQRAKRILLVQYRLSVEPEIRAWAAGVRGVGDHSLARLLGVIGHPVWARFHEWHINPNYDPDQPASEANPKRILIDNAQYFRRTVSQLWSYCGYGDPERKRKKGMTQEDALALGNVRAKTCVHIIAKGVIRSGCGSNAGKPGTELAEFYMARKEHYRETHREWTPGHVHNAALRAMKKEFLRQLWLAAGGAGLFIDDSQKGVARTELQAVAA